MQEAVQSEQKSKRIRPIKSYVRREGRITSAQKRALERLQDNTMDKARAKASLARSKNRLKILTH